MLVVWNTSAQALFVGGEGTVVPRHTFWGLQSGEVRNAQVTTVRPDDLADYCERVHRYVAAVSEVGYEAASFEVNPDILQRYSGSILLEPEGEFMCGPNPGGNLNYVVGNELPCLQFDAAHVAVWPSHHFVGWFIAYNDGTKFETQYRTNPVLRDCLRLDAGSEEMTALVETIRGDRSGSTILGNLTISDNPYATAFANPWIRAPFVVSGLAMLLLAALACTFAVRRWRAAPRVKTPGSMYVVLAANAAAMTAIGLYTTIDCGALCGNVGDTVRNSMAVGSHATATASDTLLAMLYTEAVQGPSERKGLELFCKLMVFFMLAFDVAFPVINVTFAGANNHFEHLRHVAGFFLLFRVAVLVHLTRMTLKLIGNLRSAVDFSVTAPVNNENQKLRSDKSLSPAQLAQQNLLRHLVRWVTVDILSSAATMVTLALLALDIGWTESPTAYLLLNWSSVVARILSALSSIQFCKPPSSANRAPKVHATRVTTTFGYY